jgi:hypothetical protein
MLKGSHHQRRGRRTIHDRLAVNLVKIQKLHPGIKISELCIYEM